MPKRSSADCENQVGDTITPISPPHRLMALEPVAAVRQLLYRPFKVNYENHPRPTDVPNYDSSATHHPLLPASFQVSLKDGRIIIGDFMCLDKHGNLILGNTFEQVPAKKMAGSMPEQRHMGMVLVPLAYRTSAELQVCPTVAHGSGDV